MKITKALFDHFDEFGKALLNDKGQEINDPRPLFDSATPRKPSMTEQIQRLIRSELSSQAASQEFETFEESDDFEDEDDEEPLSQYQVMDMQDESSAPDPSPPKGGKARGTPPAGEDELLKPEDFKKVLMDIKADLAKLKSEKKPPVPRDEHNG